ncbi:MAG: class I SAM-dependent methyltransferase [Pseudomonadales bacterium]
MNTAAIQLFGPATQPLQNEFEVLTRMLPFAGAQVLELGCGAAEKTRLIAERTEVNAIVAAEVDRIQHEKNLAITDLPKVTFEAFGAEAIEAPDASFDIVLMFKSLHHVPLDSMDQAFAEIRRVLKPGGLAYISEPVFDGEFNEVIRLFNDEEFVRQAAFAAVGRAIGDDGFELVEEYFFRNRVKLESFEQFRNGLINVTHTQRNVTPELIERIRERFESYRKPEGFVFEVPNRVDLLRRS